MKRKPGCVTASRRSGGLCETSAMWGQTVRHDNVSMLVSRHALWG